MTKQRRRPVEPHRRMTKQRSGSSTLARSAAAPRAAADQRCETLLEDAYVLVLRKPSNMACTALGEAAARRGLALHAARAAVPERAVGTQAEKHASKPVVQSSAVARQGRCVAVAGVIPGPR
jgi:hypothetical protein